jgi:hypothetical protein
MALARVVTFDGVTAERIEELKRRFDEGDRPDGLNPAETLVLHDSSSDRAVAVLFFDTEEDYRRGDEILDAMPAGETPGQRTSVGKYDVAIRVTP